MILSKIRVVGLLLGVLVTTTKPEVKFLMSACAIAKTPKLCTSQAKLLVQNFTCVTLPTPCAAKR